MLRGFVLFCLVCSVGVLANVDLASWLYVERSTWWVAGAVGAVMSVLWNYAMSTPCSSLAGSYGDLPRARMGEGRCSARDLWLIALCVLLLLRGVMAAALPLSADEAYYWLWSLHPAFGYFDHPPMIAWLIRAGTFVLGDTPLGVRAAGMVLSLPATWFVWRIAAALILKDEDARRAGDPVLQSHHHGVGGIAGRDAGHALHCHQLAPLSGAWRRCRPAAMANGGWPLASRRAWAAVQILRAVPGRGRLDLAAGGSRRAQMAGVHPGRIWARSWRWRSSCPILLWQSQHHWETFAFQFGRVGGGHFTLRFVVEFLGAQLGMASPLIFSS